MYKKSTDKRRQFRELIEQQIETGELQSGDRLPGIKRLCDLCGFGERIVSSVLVKLASEGILYCKRRSGYYVAVQKTEKPFSTFDPLSYLSPLPQKPFKAYITDTYPETFSVWEKGFKKAGCENIEIVTPAAGHLQTLFAPDAFDLIHSTPELLHFLGKTYDVSPKRLPLKKMVEPIQKLPSESVVYYPVSLCVPGIYVNLDLLKKTGIQSETYEDLLRAAKIIESNTPDAYGFYEHNPTDVLIASGALIPTKKQEPKLDESRTGELCRRINRAEYRCFSERNPKNKSRLFSAGKLLFMYFHSFFMASELNKSSFNWTVLPLFYPKNARIPVRLQSLAVSNATHYPEKKQAIAEKFLSPRFQNHFASCGGDLPVLSESIIVWKKAAPNFTESMKNILDRAIITNAPNSPFLQLEHRLQQIGPAFYQKNQTENG